MSEEVNNQVVITQDEINKLLSNKRGELIDGVVSGLVASARDALTYEMRYVFQETLGEEIKKVIAEEAAVIAAKFRESLRAQIISACTEVSALLATAMIEKATKELQNSWTLDKITKELF